MKIRGYSKLRKANLIELVESHKRKKQVAELEKEESIFCYPEILREIYSFAIVDDTDLQRVKKIKEAKNNLKIIDEQFKIYDTKSTRQKRQYLISIGYGGREHIKDTKLDLETLLLPLSVLMKSKKDIMYRWFRTLGYKVLRKTLKRDMKKLVEEYYTELEKLF